ncbi:MAG: hypothetical protein ACRC5T_03870, partial [Cetobacterium sp.]
MIERIKEIDKEEVETTDWEDDEDVENARIDIETQIALLGTSKENAVEKGRLKKELNKLKTISKQNKEKEKLDNWNALSSIEKFAQTEPNKMRERFLLLNEFKHDVYRNLHEIDGASYLYDEQKGIYIRITEGVNEEIYNILLDEFNLLADVYTVKALTSYYKREKKSKSFSKENTCVSFKGEIQNIYTGEMVEKNQDNIAVIYIDEKYKDFMSNDGNAWREHLKDQYGEEQGKAMLGFFYSTLLNENLEIGAIIDSDGRSGKGTIQETLTKLLG